MAFKCKRLFHSVRLGLCVLLGVLLSGCGAHVYHQVRPGDTLYSISWHYKQDYRELAAWNGLAPPYTIRQGQWLRVAPPGPEAGLAPPVYTQRPDLAEGKNASKTMETSRRPDSSATQAEESLASLSASSPSDWVWPVKGTLLRKFAAGTPGKQGIDIGGEAGAVVRAAAGGKVVYSGNGLRGYGNLIIIKHNEKFLSAYAHNQSILVDEGALVKQGDAVARMGNSETHEPKLHFQIRINGQPVDPLRYLPE